MRAFKFIGLAAIVVARLAARRSAVAERRTGRTGR